MILSVIFVSFIIWDYIILYVFFIILADVNSTVIEYIVRCIDVYYVCFILYLLFITHNGFDRWER